MSKTLMEVISFNMARATTYLCSYKIIANKSRESEQEDYEKFTPFTVL